MPGTSASPAYLHKFTAFIPSRQLSPILLYALGTSCFTDFALAPTARRLLFTAQDYPGLLDLAFRSPCLAALENIIPKSSASGLGQLAIFTPTDNQNLALVADKIHMLYVYLPAVEGYIVPITAIYQNAWLFIIKNRRLIRVDITILGDWYDNAGAQYKIVNSPKLADDDLIMTSHLGEARSGLLVDVDRDTLSTLSTGL